MVVPCDFLGMKLKMDSVFGTIFGAGSFKKEWQCVIQNFLKIGGILNGFQINKNSNASARVIQKFC